MSTRTVATDERYELVNARVTLDGHAAVVSGVRNDFATVTNHRGVGFTWSWDTVARVVATGGGRFKS